MSRFLITGLVASILLFVLGQGETKRIEILQDKEKGVTTVKAPPTPISGPKDRYHSLVGSIYFFYPTRYPAPPIDVHFELVSVVKARRLNTDLYVVFLIDGKPVHFSSNRSAIRNPVPGKSWIGERMYFLIPRERFYEMAAAEKLGVKLGAVSFDFPQEFRESIREIAKNMRLTVIR